MIIHPQVPLHRLVLSLSEAVDYVHPSVADHQHRVAYLSVNVARCLGLSRAELLNVFYAAAFHDIGMIRVENKVRAAAYGGLERIAWHSDAGYELLKDNPLFAQAAKIIRYHHLEWLGGRGTRHAGEVVPFASHIIALADFAALEISRTTPVLARAEEIVGRLTQMAGRKFNPECVDAFCEVSRPESFWFDCSSDRIYSVLLEQMDWPVLTVDEQSVVPIAEVFALVVDAASRWTATHTAGVAASAVGLAQACGFSPRELTLMRVAGYFHDIGKLTVPTEILDRPGKLPPYEWAIMRGHAYHTFRLLNTIGWLPQVCEWAAFHHERLDGKGYPFRHDAADLTLGARIMAVADVFTAVTEDRPYRKGLHQHEVISILDQQVKDGALDGDVISLLKKDFDVIDAKRQEEQATYREKQERLSSVLGSLQTSAAPPVPAPAVPSA